MHADLLAVDIDNRREHRWQAGPEPVRRLLVKSQYRRGQPDPAGAQIDGDPLVPDPTGVELSRLLDLSATLASSRYGAARSPDGVPGSASIAVEQPVFDERQHDLVEFAAAKTEGQQPAVFAVAQGQVITAIARAGATPVATLALAPS